MLKSKLITAFVLLLFFNLKISAQFYNGMRLNFGKNKIQYKDEFWSYYKYKKFNVYFNDDGKNLADYLAISAHINIQEIEVLLNQELNEKIQFIIYPSQNLSRTSNIGNIDDIIRESPTGIRTDGRKVFLYYNGNKKELDLQIRRGIAKVAYIGIKKPKAATGIAITL